MPELINTTIIIVMNVVSTTTVIIAPTILLFVGCWIIGRRGSGTRTRRRRWVIHIESE
jgi:hypothetical protein